MRCIGLMSGTSLDGVDGVLVDFDAPDHAGGRVLADTALPLPEPLRADLLALQHSGPDELHRAAQAAAALSALYAEAVHALLRRSGLTARDIAAIGAHGQTVRHLPPGHTRLGAGEAAYTVQLLAPARLAEATGIAVVADFRSRDIAAGGQGAPLVPAFHRAAFWQPGHALAVVNIGGIANVTLIDPAGHVRGFDTGPGNVLLDGWCERHTGARFDADGAWARQGRVLPALLDACLADPYFQRCGARSTGRDHFHLGWLAERLNACGLTDAAPADVQATLVALTAHTIAHALRQAATVTPEVVWVCGGGARNGLLMQALQVRLTPVPVRATSARGWPVQWVEAAAFAWLARQTLLGQAGNVPEVTGAAGSRILGALYRA
ncbi:anhydro-N-acetylmuramic acid kinase [Tepidimonas charontis]|uniref:Anhydro-N-acetylmuramic acid kinase n=1 Tax=Tepidimonas charontis TaxID=2267262 RepID=A0A554XEV7_9BURK|nr:anhydro-N-acetylmuramic acid kinase [Tepidimonas charontis]TSE34366.1 Anhydro-N-acetylmuramic acid kinase [Tepidimonas charontis]